MTTWTQLISSDADPEPMLVTVRSTLVATPTVTVAGEAVTVQARAASTGDASRQTRAVAMSADSAARHHTCAYADYATHRAQQGLLLETLQRALKGLSPG